MKKILIVYFSHGGNTKKMAQALAQSVEGAGAEAVLKKVDHTSLEELAQADGLLLGSPCYFGNMAAPIKQLLDESIKLFGKGELQGKPAGVFASTGGIGGCGELALMSLMAGLLIHGMVVQGLRKGGHLGPLSIGEPDERVLGECQAYGAQFVDLVNRLAA